VLYCVQEALHTVAFPDKLLAGQQASHYGGTGLPLPGRTVEPVSQLRLGKSQKRRTRESNAPECVGIRKAIQPTQCPRFDAVQSSGGPGDLTMSHVRRKSGTPAARDVRYKIPWDNCLSIWVFQFNI
jgi:hypothetical protein